MVPVRQPCAASGPRGPSQPLRQGMPRQRGPMARVSPATSARPVARRRAVLPGEGAVTGGSLACMPAAGPPRCDTDTNLSQIFHKSFIVLMTCHAPVWHTPSTWDAGRPHRVPQVCSDASRPRRPQGCSSPWLRAVVWVAGNLRHGA
jgi:hypothetical protein